MTKQSINPPELFNSQQYGFSQITIAQGSRLVHISGQVGWNADEQIIAKDDLGAQTRLAFENLQTAMQHAGGTLADVVALRIYIHVKVLDQSAPIRENLQRFFPQNPPAATWIGVAGLANPDFLVEVEAVAVLD